MMFKCDKCGLCCSNIGNSKIYKDLDRGDGVCKYLKDNLTPQSQPITRTAITSDKDLKGGPL